MNEYGTGFASLYDARFNGWIRGFAPELARYLLTLQKPKRRILDLCCGTGETSKTLSSAGWRVVAIDRSAAMLAVATDKLADERAAGTAELIEGDAEAFHLPQTVDGCVCIDGALNHMLTVEALQNCFRHVSLALADGAPFVFDMLEAAHFSAWQNSVTVVDDDDVMYVRRGSWDPRHNVARLHVSGVVGSGLVGWRVRETLVSRTFTNDDVTTALSLAGLVEMTCTLRDPWRDGRTIRCAIKRTDSR